jgi:hypothetical protein
MLNLSDLSRGGAIRARVAEEVLRQRPRRLPAWEHGMVQQGHGTRHLLIRTPGVQHVSNKTAQSEGGG